MTLSFEKLDVRRHDVGKAAELVYEADQSLLPLMFGGKTTGTGRISCLIEAGGNLFGYEHTYVAVDGDRMVGAVIGGTGEEYEKAEEAGPGVYYRCLAIRGTLRLLAAYPVVNRVMTNNLEADDFYVGILSVVPDRRDGGIGSFVMENMAGIAREQGCRRIVLDVSFYNGRGKKVLRAAGLRVPGPEKADPGMGRGRHLHDGEDLAAVSAVQEADYSRRDPRR